MVLTSELEEGLVSTSNVQKAALAAAPSTPTPAAHKDTYELFSDCLEKRILFYKAFPERSRMLHLKHGLKKD